MYEYLRYVLKVILYKKFRVWFPHENFWIPMYWFVLGGIPYSSQLKSKEIPYDILKWIS